MSTTEPRTERHTEQTAHGLWQAPTVTEFVLHADGAIADAGTHPLPKAPEPPAEPMVKLGFSFEASFPMSARTSTVE